MGVRVKKTANKLSFFSDASLRRLKECQVLASKPIDVPEGFSRYTLQIIKALSVKPRRIKELLIN